ncbi:S-adenosyl-L-methionine-dependent methyltransferase [Gloeophyllum trabeum ATCC 11539]|uniref:S-adenosyl-L-methionine-dependent methyltransferase n=1 Tax=Gloeophyllum trabeum (strain ATCC 11539 / FP-39264 / Madison 617) TaxID=670483 RepID=S7RQ29_GLOTA|nr:S-adenosyl-L-methionine-dependent methyltransferase [Gloeophyllum trabeum ATCC 11539]EPQ56695.1 S-adenosyl-L-methionine-dependent methyltransferase [Gloeophyllum trabeum ATCC 11539]
MLSAEKVPEGFVQAHDTPLGRLAYVINDLQANISSSDSSLSPAARSLIDEATRIVNGLDPYLTCMTSPHPPILDKMIKAGNETDWKQLHKQGKTIYELIPEMTAGSYEAVVLQQLAKTAKASAVVSQRCYTHTDLLRKAKNILEIGMFTGTTTVALALLPSVTKVVTLELEGFLADFSIPYFAEAGVAEKIEVKIGDARESLDKLAAEGVSFDMVFIDADKAGYSTYLRKVLDHNLLAAEGVIVVDNTAYKGTPWAPDPSYHLGAAIHAFNQDVRNDPTVEVVMLPIRDGISLIRRKEE